MTTHVVELHPVTVHGVPLLTAKRRKLRRGEPSKASSPAACAWPATPVVRSLVCALRLIRTLINDNGYAHSIARRRPPRRRPHRALGLCMLPEVDRLRGGKMFCRPVVGAALQHNSRLLWE